MKKTLEDNVKKILVASFFLTACLGFADVNKDKKNLFGALGYKESKLVHSYQGYFVNAVFVDGKPIVNVSFVVAPDQSSNPPAKPTITPLLTVLSKVDQKKLDLVNTQLNKIKNERPLKAVTKDVGRSLAEFDLVTKKNRKVMTEWRALNSGFKIKSVVFDEFGRVIALNYYARLVINSKRKAPIGKMKHLVRFFEANKDDDLNKGICSNGKELDDFIERYISKHFSDR